MTTRRDYRIFVIDDERIPEDGTPAVDGGGAIVVELHRTASDGLAALQEIHAAGGVVDELWLDHDLGFDDTGLLDIWPVVNWLEEVAYHGSPFNATFIFVHTANPAGGLRMVAALERYYLVKRDTLPTK